MLNWVASPEAQNAPWREDGALMRQCRPEGGVFQSRPAHRLVIAIKDQVEPSWTDAQHEFDLSIIRGNDLSRMCIDAEICLDVDRRRFKDDGFGIDVERRKVWADGNATLTPHRKWLSGCCAIQRQREKKNESEREAREPLHVAHSVRA